MRIGLENLKEIIKKYRTFLINKRIVDIVLVNSRLFLFYLKNEETKLIIDLDNNNPHIGLIKVNYDELTLPSEFIAKALGKGRPLITDVEIINNDKVIKITTMATDAFYHQNKYYLYIELINAHGNMILTDENNKIITAFYETNALSPRLIVKNNKYSLPDRKIDNFTNLNFTIKNYEKDVEKSFILGINKRKNELYGSYIKKYEKKIKSLNKKIKKIKENKQHAKLSLNSKEIGNILLMNASSIKKGDTSYQKIKLDPTKNPIENANMYFNKYKKAKRALEMVDQFLLDANRELEENNYFLDVFKYGNEKEIATLIKPNYKVKKDSPAYLPYFVNWQNVTYYFGHNALENDYLTFKMFKKTSDVTWLHIKDTPSSHLIINKGSPTNQELDIACSLLLIKNKLTSGEIIYTNRKNITRGEQLAKANILRYQSVNIRKLNPIALDIIKKERRVHE